MVDPNLDDDEEEDEESKLPSRCHLAIAANQIFLIYLYYSIVIPTAHDYSASLGAPRGFAGVLVGATSIGAAMVPARRAARLNVLDAISHE